MSISVVCTFLDAEATLEATLESLRLQTAPGVSFCLVDDGSSDRSTDIAKRFVARDSRFSLHANPRPGRVRALNFAVEAIDADYVAVLDADDLAHPAWLAEAVVATEAEPEFAVIGFERLFIRDSEEPNWLTGDLQSDLRVRDVTRRIAQGNPIGHSGAVIHRPGILAVGGYDARLRILEDYDLWIRLAKAGRPLGVCRSVRVAKRYHDGQKFARMQGFSLAAWKVQFRAIMTIDRDFRNFMRLGLRIATEVTRRPRHLLASGLRRR
jgi:glycosyltransferase involved in cell wall biosynthesis